MELVVYQCVYMYTYGRTKKKKPKLAGGEREQKKGSGEHNLLTQWGKDYRKSKKKERELEKSIMQVKNKPKMGN